jgi:hypothetical protein
MRMRPARARGTGKPAFHALHGCSQRGRGARDRTSDCVAGAVPLPDLRQAIADSHRLSVRAGRHVAIDQGLGQVARRRPELTNQLSGEAAFLCLGHGTGVMRNHPAQQRLCTFNVAEVPGAVQGMEPGGVQVRRISDVVQPRGCHDQLGIFSEQPTQRPGLRGHALRMRPAAGKRIFQEFTSCALCPFGKFHGS